MELTDEQLAVANAEEERVVVRALAGTGKTQAVTARVTTQYNKGNLVPEETACLSFTNAAVNNATERFSREGIEGITTRTIDSMAFHLVKEFLESKGYELTLTDGKDVMRDLLQRYGLGSSSGEVNAMLQMSNLRWFGRPIKSSVPGISASDVPQVLSDYDQEKRRRKIMDFNDIIVLASEIPCRKFEEIILDEAQDSNDAHLRFIEHISNGRVVFVGDENQSIYDFSGVNPNLFKDYCSDWHSLPLTKSFRSSSNVLRTVNSVLKDGVSLSPFQQGDPGTVVNGSNVLRCLDAFLELPGSKGILTRTRYGGIVETVVQIVEALGLQPGFSWNGDSRFDSDIYISTVHASKGFEWDNVLVVGLNALGFVGTMEQEVESERRIAYVAASRARKNLVLHSVDGMVPYSYGGSKL